MEPSYVDFQQRLGIKTRVCIALNRLSALVTDNLVCSCDVFHTALSFS